MKMNKLKSIIVLLLCVNSFLSIAEDKEKKPAKTQAQKMFFDQMMSGDLTNIKSVLEGVDGAQDVLKKFEARFHHNQHGIDYNKITDPLTRKILKLYQEYWKEALLSPENLASLEQQLQLDLNVIIKNSGKVSGEVTLEDTSEPLSDYMAEQGYYSLLGGRVNIFYEFMVWTKNEEHEYKIELTDGIHTIKVTQISDFINRGWMHYASNGIGSVGGWALDDRLICLCDTYDLDSEKFKVSYLKHEGRHFADYKKYPLLETSTLEYRAKLTEIIYAKKTTYDLLEVFAQRGRENGPVGHTLANWHVIKGLTELTKPKQNNDNKIDWQSVPVLKIQTAARQLLEANDKLITKLGKNTTKETIFVSKK